MQAQGSTFKRKHYRNAISRRPHNSSAGLAANFSRSSQIARSQSDAATMYRGSAAHAARATGVGSACR